MTNYKSNMMKAPVLALASFTLLLSGCGKAPVEQQESPQPIQVRVIGNAQEDSFREFPATAQASGLVNLSFRISGELIELNATAGRQFKKGEILAKLDPADYERRVQDMKAAYDLSKKNLGRAEKLLPNQAISQSEYDIMEATYLIDKANLELAQQRLKYTVLRAPKNGRVSDVPLENFESVLAGKTVMLIEDFDKIEIDVQVAEKLAGITRTNQERDMTYQPIVTFTTFPDKDYLASYKEHETELDPSTKSYIYTLVMDTNDIDKTILPGMSAKVRVNMSRVSRVTSSVTLPSRSVYFRHTTALDAEGAYVWVFDPSSNTVKSKDVKVGELVDDGIQIVAGLSPQDQVVVLGSATLYEGEEVMVEGESN